MHKKLILFALIIIFQFSFNKTLSQSDSLKRPKVGLVLSGGGAKGLSHIGALKIIEKYNIPIDYITGTSMGSIVGALYAMGYKSSEIEEIAKNINWSEIFEDKINKASVSIVEKPEHGIYILKIPFENWKPVIPKGVISGQLLEMLLAKLTWSVHGVNNFQKLPIPFKCIATDIETGKAVVLSKGYLPDAIRASMSIPSVFSPIVIDDKLLVDGGIIRNLPASDAKKMGADIIIAVDVGASLYKKNEISSMLDIMDQAASFRNDVLSKKEKKLCDILISPNIKGYSASSFNKIDSLIVNGEIAAKKNSTQLEELEIQFKKYNYSNNRIIIPAKLHTIFINDIKIEGLNKVSKNLVYSKLQIKSGKWFSLKKIEESIKRLYGSKYFEKVNYRIIQNKKTNTLLIKIKEKPFSDFKLAVNYNNVFNASLLLNTTFRNIIGEGSKLIIKAKLGDIPEANIKYSIYTKYRPSIGFNLDFGYYYMEEKRYNFLDSLNVKINKNLFHSKLSLVSSVSNSLSITIGSEINYKNYDIIEFDSYTYKADISYLQFFGKIYLDTYDKFIYPNLGILLKANVDIITNEFAKSQYSTNNNFWKANLTYKQNIPITKKLNFSTKINAATIIGKDIFIADYYYIGGNIDFKDYIFSFKGFKFMEYSSTNFLIGGLGLRFEAWKNKYFSIYANTAKFSDNYNDLFNIEGIVTGASLCFGINTIIGPLEFAVSKNDQNNEFNYWIQLGFYF